MVGQAIPRSNPSSKIKACATVVSNMRREGRYVTGRGDYILSMDRCSFSNAGVREARLIKDHQMIL